MKRALSALVGISILLAGLSIGYPLSSASAMADSTGNANTCADGYPAPYTGGAGVAKYFHLSDGSTVTITTTGAVIKQSPCHTAYREGWIKVSDICNFNSAQELNGRLSSGDTNPYGSGSFSSCSSGSQSSAAQRPTQNAAPVQTQTQSQSITINNPAPVVQAASTTAPAKSTAAQQTAAVKTLPNTGPGNIIGLSGVATIFGTVGHYLFVRRRRFFA